MNKDLVKPKSDKKKHLSKYMERHLTLCVTLDKKNDKDIIDWLAKQQNRSQTVRSILRDFILLDGTYQEEK